jgi:hypothetical protein
MGRRSKKFFKRQKKQPISVGTCIWVDEDAKALESNSRHTEVPHEIEDMKVDSL